MKKALSKVGPIIEKTGRAVDKFGKVTAVIKDIARDQKKLALKSISYCDKLSKEEKSYVKKAMELLFKKQYGV